MLSWLIANLATLFSHIAYGAVKGALAAWSEMGPQIVSSTVAAWRRAFQATITDAEQAPAPLVSQLQQEIADAQTPKP